MLDVEPYIPNDKQIEAHCAIQQLVGYGGAMGGGKSRWLCEMAKQLSVMFPGNFGVMARQSGVVLRMSTQEVFFTEVLIPGSEEWNRLKCKWDKAENVLFFNALNPPSRIWFTGLDNDNIERVKSLNLGWFGIDEATEVSESVFLMLMTRLRRKNVPKEFRKGMISANPEAGWIKRRFIDQQLPNHKFIFATFRDNPHLPEEYPELFASMPIRWQQKYLYGNWAAASGLIYKEFKKEHHVLPRRPFPPEWRYMRGLDHGSQNPTACPGFAYGHTDSESLAGFLGDRMDLVDRRFDKYPFIVMDRMYYGIGLISHHRQAIAKTFDGVAKPGLTFADPSIWIKGGIEKVVADTGKKVPWATINEYRESPYPLSGLVKGNNQVAVGLDRVSTLLQIGHLFFIDDDSLEPIIGDAGEMLTYSWKEPPKEDQDWPEEPDKKNDHACDAMRYAIMSLPPISFTERKVIPYNSFAAARQRAILHKKGKSGITADGFVVGRRGKLRRLWNARGV